MCPPVFSFVDVPRGSAAWEERVSQPIMDFCPSQPTRRLSRLSLQGAFLVDNFNYGDRIIRWIVSSVAGAPMVMMLNIAGKRGPAASASARPGPPPSACNPDRPAGFRPAGPCTCQMERCRRSRRGLRLDLDLDLDLVVFVFWRAIGYLGRGLASGRPGRPCISGAASASTFVSAIRCN
jgi:hypothetical protein